MTTSPNGQVAQWDEGTALRALPVLREQETLSWIGQTPQMLRATTGTSWPHPERWQTALSAERAGHEVSGH